MGIFGSGQGFLLRSLRGTEWSQFLDYVSPSFLDVVPARHLLAQGREMLGNARDGGRFERVRGEVQAALAKRGVAVRIVPGDEAGDAGPISQQDEPARHALGQRALEIYFGQLFCGDTAILDLRAARFAAAADPEGPRWFPRPFYLHWQAEFLAGIRDLYLGFYRDDEPRFEAGLDALDLRVAGDVFREHFGGGDQRSVRFQTDVFHSTFHEVFVRCRDAGVSLHRNFLALGVYLACLYDCLEPLDLELDVRAAFDRAAG